MRCPELVDALRKAGLASLTPYAWQTQTSSAGEGSFAKGSPTPTLKAPCAGALPREHSHFFTQSGMFGSLDWLGGQVDDGSYQVVDDNTMRIGSVTFRYAIKGNELTMSPQLTKSMIRQALSKPDDYSDAGWAISVAIPGQTWHRVPCGSWC